MLTNTQLGHLKRVRVFCDQGAPGCDCSAAEVREAIQPVIAGVEEVIKAIEDDWYTPCAVLFCWLSVTEIAPNTFSSDIIPRSVWNGFFDALRAENRSDAAIWALGQSLLTAEIGDRFDIPDKVWCSFERVYELCDPDFGNHNMN